MTTVREEAERQFPNNTVYHDGAYAGFIAGAEWQRQQPVTITAEQVWKIAKYQHDFANDHDNLDAYIEPVIEAMRVAGLKVEDTEFINDGYVLAKQPVEITDEMVGKAQLALIRNSNIPTSEGPWLIGTRLYLGQNKEVDMYDVVYAVLEAALGGSDE